MNVYKLVLEYVNNYKEDEPIFIEAVKKHISKFFDKNEQEKIFRNVNVILNRLNKEGIIKTAYKGIYYKPITTIFGEMPLDKTKVREQKYIKDNDGNIKGYLVGAKLFNSFGLTTQVPNIMEVVTNECKYHNGYDKELKVHIKKPKITVTNDKWKYLQFLELLDNTDDINIENSNPNEIYYKYIETYNLDFEKIIKNARDTKNPRILKKLYILAK
jgi:hypothetical protein